MLDPAILRQHPELIDMSIFNEILEMDQGDDDHEFSSSLCYNWMDEFTTVYQQLEEAMSVKFVILLPTEKEA
jgi:hypothetical protein